MNKRLLLALAFSALLVAGILVLATGGDDSPNENDSRDETSQTDTKEATRDDASSEEPETEPDDSVPGEKDPQPTARVSERPEIFTAYGHVESDPVKQDQTTSTTCTTEPNTDCIITFTNADTGESISLQTKKSNSEGVAFWTWIGGQDVPSGTWLVTATAGDKTSEKETVYVQ